ncbi:MAG: hypothetical protein Q9212_006756 [Teloschistes hypoglaucus]
MHPILNDDPDALNFDTTPELQEAEHLSGTPRQTHIVNEKYNITLQPASQAEEKYNFNKFHVHGCDQSKCDGKCGQAQPKELSKEISKRRKSDDQRRKDAEIKKGSSKQTLADRVEEPGDDDFVVKSPQKVNIPKRKLAEKVEEPGDDDFVVKKKKILQNGDTPRQKKQARVRFADQ